MAKEKSMTSGGLLSEMFHLGLYKRTQGRITRQVTCGVVWVTFVIAAWRLWSTMVVWPIHVRYVLAAILLVGGLWFGFRLVNYPRFADFLIAVEAEMNKVSWPSWPELVRSSMVVIIVIFLLASLLFGFDLLWQSLFKLIGVSGGG